MTGLLAGVILWVSSFSWVPTLNQNHHQFINREGAYTITYRVCEKNNLWTLLSYPSISSYWQQFPIGVFLTRAWHTRRGHFWYCLSQFAVLVLFVGVALLVDWKKALLYVVLPQQVGLFSVLIFNYQQHVGADEGSEWEHSRDMVSPVMNLFLFNNGCHAVNHAKPRQHWSEFPLEHANVRDKLNPVLSEKSRLWLILRTYLIAPLVPVWWRPNLRVTRLDRASID